MPVKRRVSKRREAVEDEAFAWLRGQPCDGWFYFQSEDDLAALWQANVTEVIAEWVEENPGSRPELWWRYSAIEPRRQLGGSGVPGWRDLAYVETYRVGLPSSWVGADLDDLPRFESQAAYLDRLRLWQPGERRRAPASAFEPEAITA